MDKKKLNLILGIGVLLGSYLIVRHFYKKSQTPDELTIEVSNLNNKNQSFDYVILKNGTEFKKGSFNTRMPSEAFIQFKNKIQFDNGLNSITISGTSADTSQFKKIIKFKKSDDPKIDESEMIPSIIDVKVK